MKKTISFLLTILLLFSAVPFASAEGTADGPAPFVLTGEETVLFALTQTNALPDGGYGFRLLADDPEVETCDWYIRTADAEEYSFVGSSTDTGVDLTVSAENAILGINVKCIASHTASDGDTIMNELYAVLGVAPEVTPAEAETLVVDADTLRIETAGSYTREFYTVSAGIVCDGEDCTFQWYVTDGGKAAALEGQTSPALTDYELDAEYVRSCESVFCRVTAPNGLSADSGLFTLRLSTYEGVHVKAEPRVLTTDDKDEDGNYICRLTAAASGKKPTYVWLYRPVNTFDWLTVPEEYTDKAKLTFPVNAEETDMFSGISFRCMVSYKDGEIGISAPVTVCAAPEVTFAPDAPIYLSAGKTELLRQASCAADAKGAGELTYTWKYVLGNNTFTAASGTASEYVYTFTDEQLTAAGDDAVGLFCEVADFRGNVTVSDTAEAYVVDTPVIKTGLPAVYYYKLNEFDALDETYSGHTFTADTEGKALTYEWFVSTDDGGTWLSYPTEEGSFTPCVSEEDFDVNSSFLIRFRVWAGGIVYADSAVCRCLSVPRITAELPAVLYVNADKPETSDGEKVYSVSASIEAKGCSELSYQWYYWDAAAEKPGYKPFAGETSPTLTNAKISKDNVAWTSFIYCAVTDAYGNETVSSSARITAVHGAQLTIPEQIVVTKDDFEDGVYNCTVTAEVKTVKDSPVTLSWYCAVDDGDWIKIGGDTETLEAFFEEPALLKTVRIKVRAEMFNGIVSESEPCTIRVTPFFLEAPAAQKTAVGETGSITAEAFSNDEIRWQWYVLTHIHEVDDSMGTENDRDEWIKLEDNDVYSGTATDTLTVKINDEDLLRKVFRCTAETDYASTDSEPVKFAKPDIVFTKDLTNISVALGGTAVFEIAADGMDLTYHWQMFNPKTNVWDSISSVKGTTLKIKADSVKAYDYRFRCSVSDGDKTAVTAEACLLRSTDVLRGDVDLDGKVDAADARLALRAAVGLENYRPEFASFIAADWDANGKIEAGDARMILRHAVGLE